MTKEIKPKIAIFKNNRAPKAGDKFTPPAYNGKITLPEGLPAGEYDVGIYINESKTGLKFMSGNIKPAFKPKEPISKHNIDKSNGYQPQETEDDEIPF
jgi:hypothetical protein